MSNSSADRFPDLLQLPSGLKLQISMTYPSEERPGSKKLAVCSHAWSRVGGNINDPYARFYPRTSRIPADPRPDASTSVLRSLVKPLCSRLGYHVLLFSARGVGSSSGWASFTGFQEALDLQELVAYAVEKLGGVEDLVLAGYSNGCLSTSLHPPLPPPTRTSYILLSYPLDVRHWLTAFNSRKYQKGLEDLIRHPDSRVLVIYSDRDEFTYIASYARWVSNLEAIAAEPSKDATGREEEGEEPASRPSEHYPDGPRMQAVCIDGANHYWRGGDLTRMLAAVEGFLKAR